MEIPAWDDVLKVDGGPLDLQHQQLLTLTATISEKAKIGATTEAQELFRQLYLDCMRHFADEEAFMTAIAFPHRDEHQGEHQRLLTHVAHRLTDAGNDPTRQNIGPIMDCLRSLVVMHIINDDMEIRDFIKRTGDHR